MKKLPGENLNATEKQVSQLPISNYPLGNKDLFLSHPIYLADAADLDHPLRLFLHLIHLSPTIHILYHLP